MTRQPPHPRSVYEDRQRAALVKNLLGLTLLVAGPVGLGVVAWFVHPLLFAALACAGVTGLGYLLATAETGEN